MSALGGFKFGAGINVLHSELGQFYASDPRIAATGACDRFDRRAARGDQLHQPEAAAARPMRRT